MWDTGQRTIGFDPGPVPIEPSEPRDVEWRVLRRLGYEVDFLHAARTAAHRYGLTLAEELIRTGHLDARVWWRSVANHLQVRFYPSAYLQPMPASVTLPPFRRVRQALGRSPGGRSRLYIAPRGVEIDRLEATLTADPDLRPRYVVVSPATISQAIVDAYAPAITRTAVEQLRQNRPDMSASDAAAIQTRLIGVLSLGLVLLATAPQISILALNTVFLILGGMRLASAFREETNEPPPLLPDDVLPTYSVLVPLYREAAVVPSLAAALARIDYPRHKVSIFIIVEADDIETIRAVRRIGRGLLFRLLIVPPSLPRTKPKALCWALPFVESELVTIF